MKPAKKKMFQRFLVCMLCHMLYMVYVKLYVYYMLCYVMLQYVTVCYMLCYIICCYTVCYVVLCYVLCYGVSYPGFQCHCFCLVPSSGQLLSSLLNRILLSFSLPLRTRFSCELKSKKVCSPWFSGYNSSCIFLIFVHFLKIISEPFALIICL